jgi:hypothetical protein
VIPPGSRYSTAEHVFTACHAYSKWNYPLLVRDEQQSALRVRTQVRDTLYLVTTVPDPAPPPMEYYAKEDESMQFLAYKFLDDPNRWHEIANANPKVWYPLDMKPGEYLRIPS